MHRHDTSTRSWFALGAQLATSGRLTATHDHVLCVRGISMPRGAVSNSFMSTLVFAADAEQCWVVGVVFVVLLSVA